MPASSARNARAAVPVAGITESSALGDHRGCTWAPGDELLDSDIIWMCVSCETCSARCPMGIDVAAVMDALRALAEAKGAAKPEGNVPLFNRLLLKTVKIFGRTYDLAAMALYKTGTATYGPTRKSSQIM